MIDLKMFNTEKELSILTGLNHDELWDSGFNLDDWDVCFVSDVPLDDDWSNEAWWLVLKMECHCVGYEHTEYNGKHYYMVYHS